MSQRNGYDRVRTDQVDHYGRIKGEGGAKITDFEASETITPDLNSETGKIFFDLDVKTDIVSVPATDISFSSVQFTYANLSMDIIDTHTTEVICFLALSVLPTAEISGSVQVGQLKLKETGVNILHTTYGGCFSSSVFGAGYAFNSSTAGLYIQVPSATSGIIYLSTTIKVNRADLVTAGVLS